MRRSKPRGATLGLVAAFCLLVLMIGVFMFFLARLFGGARELQNAGDSGALSVATKAISQPSKGLRDFANSDIANNFLFVADNENANLRCYNRIVAQAMIVALNAKEEDTTQSADNAKKLWQAVNDVGQFLRSSLDNRSTVEPWFLSLANANNIKMLGVNSSTSLVSHDVAFMRPGGSTNVYLEQALLTDLVGSSAIPRSKSNLKSPGGATYLGGYQPMTVDLVTGDRLTFCGVPVFPQIKPHLVDIGEFDENSSDEFITSTGGYPSGVLPPNSFKLASKAPTHHGNELWCHSCSIVGLAAAALAFGGDDWSKGHSMAIPGGYIAIKNGPSAPMPSRLPGNATDDIFAHELAGWGIFTQGSAPSDMFTRATGLKLWNDWCAHNTQGGPQPDLAESQIQFRRGDGYAVTLEQLQSINTMAEYDALAGTAVGLTQCNCTDYDDPSPTPVCVAALANFKVGYNRPGSVDNGHMGTDGLTTMELFKIDVLASRYDVTACADVRAPRHESGVKWFDHELAAASSSNSPYAAPKNINYDFGQVKTPFQYLEMMEQVSQGTLENVVTALTQRCREIKPSVTKAQVEELLKSKELPLGATLYIYLSGGALKLHDSPPPWAVTGTTTDGAQRRFGESYEVEETFLNIGAARWRVGDGDFDKPYIRTPECSCKDEALWSPSSGYNNFLGELKFVNTCSGGGQWCQPN